MSPRAPQAALPELARLLWAAGDGERTWHSIWLNINTAPTNVIFSHEPGAWVPVLGERVLVETIASGSPIALLPHTFRQPNLEVRQSPAG